jgi:uncharacterized protein
MTTIARIALALVGPQFALDQKSRIHGAPHWARVAHNGRVLAEAHGVNPDITEWFAYLHDSQRRNDDRDPLHGARAAAYAWSLREANVIKLAEPEFYQLQYALATHSDGFTNAPMAVACCWDADRLDLPRVGVRPDPARMATHQGSRMAEKLWR